jgi:RNA polymerase sigma-70 factor (ECF subfamily)
MSDDDVLLKAQAGDPDAIAQIIRTHQALIRGTVARLAPDAVSADDLAQEVFLAALRSLDRVDPQRGIRDYLLGIARNKGRLAWRERMQGKEISGDALFSAISARCPDVDADAASDRRVPALQECLKGLAPKALEVVLRHYREGQACDEISRQIGSTPGNIRSILTRARQALRDCIRIRIQGATT